MITPRLLSVACLAAALACGSSSKSVVAPPPPLPVETIAVTPVRDTVAVQAAVQVNAVARDSLGGVVSSAIIAWSSANGAVARVGLAGQVTGLAPGQAWVRASSNGASDSALVTVLAGATGSVSVSPSVDSLATGTVMGLQAVVRDTAGAVISGATVTWTTGNSGVATVTSGGFVTGAGAGATTITATHGGTSGSAQITVRNGLVRADSVKVPLIDLGGTYLGFFGRLYQGGNTTPASHAAAGVALARTVTPLDINGQPNAGGKYVLLSVGVSNATQEWCVQRFGNPCDPWTFTRQAAADPLVRTNGLTIVNGAESGKNTTFWLTSTSAEWDRIRDSALAPAGLSEKQVQAIWIKHAEAIPAGSLPSTGADAFVHEVNLGKILRAAKVRYPNLKLVYITSRIYAGYSITTLSPEPYVYEYGLATKWLIDAQIRQMASGGTLIDPTAGDLNYANGTAPWVDWGPYLWASGTTPRSDGLTWVLSDFENDGTHPSVAGETKVAGFLLTFFLTSPTTRCWFATTGTCP